MKTLRLCSNTLECTVHSFAAVVRAIVVAIHYTIEMILVEDAKWMFFCKVEFE